MTNVISVIALIIFIPLFLLVSYQSIRFVTHASGTKASVTVDTTAILEPIRTSYAHAFVQGDISDLASIKNRVQPLAPLVIRIDNIFDRYDIVTKNGTAISYHFEKLDQAVNTILSLGAKPLFSLAFMPRAIAKEGTVTNPPNNWNNWTDVVQKTIEHYSGTSGKNISGVSYEIWNEPDLLSSGTWGLSGEKNYLTLYRYAVQGAQQAKNVNTFAIGGPATSTINKNWIVAMATSGLRTDFFSWHSFTSDPKQFTTDQEQMTAWLTPYPASMTKPTMVTAFGFSREKSPLYQTNYAAAYTAAVLRERISGGPTYLFTYELQDRSDIVGLISATDSAKIRPGYGVYAFIDTMTGNRLKLTGEGSWVTGFASIRDGIIRTLLINFDPSGNHIEQTPVTFTHLSGSSYRVTQKSFSGQTTQQDVSVVGGTMTRTVYMPSQSIIMLEIKKK